MKLRIAFYALTMLLSGCITYSAVDPGTTDLSGLQVDSSQAWNQAPREATPALRPGSKVWTRDGVLLDRIIIIPSVPAGEPLFIIREEGQKLPEFQADMLANEIEELTELSIVKLFGEGEVAVQTMNLRPHQFAKSSGILFDISLEVSDGPNYRGVTGAFIVNDELYMLIYLGAEPYYYEKHLDEALVIIKGARLADV